MKFIYTLLLGSILCFFTSCEKEVKISRNNETIIEELTDVSAIYITKKNNKIELNKNNLITNTHWVFVIDRNIQLHEIETELQKIVAKKHKKGGMHEDNKRMYFIYSDTTHKRNAYVEFPVERIVLDPTTSPSDSLKSVFAHTNIEELVQQLLEWHHQKPTDSTRYILQIIKK